MKLTQLCVRCVGIGVGCGGTPHTHCAHDERKKSEGKQQKRGRPMNASLLSPIPLVSFSTRTKPQERNAEPDKAGISGQDGWLVGTDKKMDYIGCLFSPFHSVESVLWVPGGLLGSRASARSLRRRCLSLYSSHSRSPFHTLYIHI